MSDAAAALEAGMRAMLAAHRESLARGVPRLGWKIGLNDPAIQRTFDLDGVVVGALAGDRRIAAGGTCSLAPRAKTFVEAELAVRLGADVDAAAGARAAAAAVEAAAPAIEVVDYAHPSDGLESMLAHSVFHEASVIGEERSPDTVARIGAGVPVVFRDGIREREPDARLVLRDLGAVLARAARLLAPHGESLRRGDWVLTGSWVVPLSVRPSQLIDVDFGALGRVSAHFEIR